jgi:hypothetical protein
VRRQPAEANADQMSMPVIDFFVIDGTHYALSSTNRDMLSNGMNSTCQSTEGAFITYARFLRSQQAHASNYIQPRLVHSYKSHGFELTTLPIGTLQWLSDW